MSAPKGVVLLASAVVSSPLVRLLHEGSITLDQAVLRAAVSLVICYLALTAVAVLAFSPRPAPVERPDTEDAPGVTVAPGGSTSE